MIDLKENLVPFSFGGLPNGADDLEEARIVILPVPFDGTVSYRTGTRDGPRAIIEASRNMELYDEELGLEVSDIGIFTLNELEPTLKSPEAMTLRVRDRVGAILKSEKFPVMLGGEHSITIGGVMALKTQYPELSVLQLDAHGDLRDAYWGSPYSHASAMRRALEFAPVTQVGLRSASREEAKRLRENAERIFWARDIAGKRDWLEGMINGLSDQVYLTIDLDVLDPSIMPSVGTPEPGGLLWYETLNILKAVCKKKEVVGFDIVELLPNTGNIAPDFLAARLTSKLAALIFAEKIFPQAEY